MTGTLQTYLTTATQTACDDLITAFEKLPEDKRDWSPGGDARTAVDMIAECVMLTDLSEIIKTRTFTYDMAAYEPNKAALAKTDWPTLKAALQDATTKAIATIQTVPDKDLDIEVQMPWGPMSIARIIINGYWNMSYHEAQINYIASILGGMNKATM